jgi:hypothetical protein
MTIQGQGNLFARISEDERKEEERKKGWSKKKHREGKEREHAETSSPTSVCTHGR